MGLDVFSKTVGVAISDAFGFTARAFEIIDKWITRPILCFDRVRELWYLQGGTICSGLS